MAVTDVVRLNGPDRFYSCQQSGFGFQYEERVTPEGLCAFPIASDLHEDDTFEVVEAGGHAWILRRGLVAFRPVPIYSKMTAAGQEPPYLWRFDERNLLDQVDDVCVGFGVRLVAGRVNYAPFRAYFVDNSGTLPPRIVHGNRYFGYFAGHTLDEAVWAAVHDIRRANPVLRTRAS